VNYERNKKGARFFETQCNTYFLIKNDERQVISASVGCRRLWI